MRGRIWRWSAIVLMVFCVGGISKRYLGRNMYIREQPIIYQDEQMGLHFQVDQVVIGKETALLTSQLSKLDGSPFEEGLDAYEFEFSKEGSSRGSARIQKGLSEDKKTIYMVLDMNYEALRQLKAITVSAVSIIGEDEEKIEITIPVVQNYKNQSIRLNRKIAAGESDTVIKEVIIDPLQIIIKGKQGKEGKKLALLEGEIVALQMKKGELVELEVERIEGLHEERFEYRFGPVEVNEVEGVHLPRIFYLEDIEALIIGNELIKAPH